MATSPSYIPPPSSQPPHGRPFGLRLSPLPHHAHNHTSLTPLSFLLRAALIHPDRLALDHPERGWHLTFSQWAARSLSLAFALAGRPDKGGEGCLEGWKGKGTRVAILSPNAPLILDAYHGVLAAGGIVVPLNYRNTKQELGYVLEHSGASIILVDWELKHLIEGSNSQGRSVVISHDSGGQDPNDPYEAFLAHGRKLWDACQAAEDEAYGSTNSARRDWELLPTVEETDPLSVCYTSGTTGRPKGVVSTHRGTYLAATANALESRLDANSRYLWVLPAFHACGWTYPWSCTLSFATQHVLRRVDPQLIWEALKMKGVTHYCGAPTVHISLVHHASAQRLPKPVYVAVAASAPTADLLARMEALNLLPVHVYGLTETYGPMTRRYPADHWAGLGVEERAKLMARQGHAFLTADEARVIRVDANNGNVAVRDPRGRLVDVERDGSELGEIALRGNIVMAGYYNDEAATRKVVLGSRDTASGDGEWFLSGDLAVRHPGGEVEVRDRGKDIVISGGENVSSLAVEADLAAHPRVRESCVVARKHERWGERCHAFVVLNEPVEKGERTKVGEEIKKWCKGRMSGFAVPEWVDVVEELPKVSARRV